MTGRLDPSRLQPAFDVVARDVGEGLLPGAVLAVATIDGVIRCEAFSGQDRVHPDTAFMVASITKPITATAIMQLVQEGRLVLGERVATYLPEFAPPPVEPGAPGGEAVTIWHVLTHTAGIPDIDEAALARERPSAADLFARCCAGRLRARPGTRFEYTSNSFSVLSELIARLSGDGYAAYLRERILGPLGMTRTSFEPPDAAVRAPVRGLDLPEVIVPMALAYLGSLAMPGGGLWSTAEDVTTFGRAMLGGGRLGDVRVLARPFVDLMTREQTAGLLDAGDPPRPAHYALGWSKPGVETTAPCGQEAFSHGGHTGSRLHVDPDAGIVVTVLANRWYASSRTSRSAIDAVYGAVD